MLSLGLTFWRRSGPPPESPATWQPDPSRPRKDFVTRRGADPLFTALARVGPACDQCALWCSGRTGAGRTRRDVRCLVGVVHHGLRCSRSTRQALGRRKGTRHPLSLAAPAAQKLQPPPSRAGQGRWQHGPPPLAPATGAQRQGAPKTCLRPGASLGLANW